MTEEEIIFNHEKHIECGLIVCLVEIDGKKYEVYYDPDNSMYEKYEIKIGA